MGINYRAYLIDEFDWEYSDYTKDEAIDYILSMSGSFKIKCNIAGLLIVDTDKTYPAVFFNKIPFDNLLMTSDNELVPTEIFTKSPHTRVE